jgi:WD40 repeat protein
VNAVALSPDGRQILSAAGYGTAGDFYVWNLRTRKLQLKVTGENIMGLAVSPDGQYAVCAGIEGTVVIWDLKTRRKRTSLREGCQLKGHTASAECVVVTPDGRHVISASRDGTLKVWTIKDHLRAKPIQDQITEFLRGLQRNKSAQYAEKVQRLAADVVAQPDPHASELNNDINHLKELLFGLLLFGPTDLSGKTLMGHTDAVNSVALTPDGSKAISASDDHSLRVWDLDSGQEITSFTLECAVLSCAVSPSGVIVAGDESGRVHFLELVGVK